MSKYTTEVRYICETSAGYLEQQGYRPVNEILIEAAPKVFDFSYPIFDESYRQVLETKILKHYYTREICEESIGLWKLRLDTRMNEIMPYYNQLYKSELLSFNPLYDVDLKTVSNKVGNTDNTADGTTNGKTTNSGKSESTTVDDGTVKTNGKTTGEGTTANVTNDTTSTESSGSTTNESTTTGEGKTTGKSTGKTSDTTSGKTTGTSDDLKWNMYSDTPQSTISDLDEGKYLTNATKTTDKLSTSGTSDTTSNGTSESSTEGTSSDSTKVSGKGTSSDTSKTTGSSSTAGSTSDTSTSESTTKTDDTRKTTGTSSGDSSTDTTTHNTSNIKTAEDYLNHVVGKSAGKSYSAMLSEFRQTFLNIDMMVINDLQDLFFGLW
jgi:hypothetical protein